MDEDIVSDFSAFEAFLDNMTVSRPDTSLTVSDYIEVVYNLTAMLIGVPINIWAMHGHVKALRSRPGHARLIWLGVHLTIANLMILLVHSAGTVIWLLTYFWYGGDFLCRVFKCLSIVSFQISSNVVVSIALDMFHSLHAPLRSQIRDGRKRVRLFLTISWTLAILLAFPQLFLWGEADDPLSPPMSGYKICAFLFYQNTEFTRGYNFAHLVCVFYIPLVFILFCYLGSAYHVWKHLRLQSSLIQHEIDARKQSTGSGLMITVPENGYGHRRQSILTTLYQRRRSSNIERQTRTKVRLLRKSASVIGVYVICWLPYQIFSVWQSFCDSECEKKHYEVIATKLRWLEALMISCACINPFLYTFVRHRQPASTDSPRRGSNEVAGTFSGNRKNSMFTNESKRDSLLAMGTQHSQLLPLRRTSCAAPK